MGPGELNITTADTTPNIGNMTGIEISTKKTSQQRLIIL